MLFLLILTLLTLTSTTPTCPPNTWTNLTSLPSPRQEHGTAALPNTIAILGGITSTNMTTTDLFQLYNITTNTWHTAPPAPTPLNHANIASIGPRLYLLGGLLEAPTTQSRLFNWVASGASHVYDIDSNKWSPLPPMPPGTERGSAIVGVHEQIIYLAGGMTILQPGYQDAVNSVLAFNTTSNSWKRLPPSAAELPESRQHGAGAVIDDTFYLVGGRRYGFAHNKDTIFTLDLTNLSSGWKILPANMPIARGGLSGAAIGDKFYAFGGEGNPDSETGVFDQSEVFDVVEGRWSELGVMAVPRHGTQAIAVGGRVYVPGGGLQQEGRWPTGHFDVYCV